MVEDVTGWLAILVSGATGAVVTLLGVVTGGAVASRSQRRQWEREKQIDACAVVVQESTRMQLALRQQWSTKEKADWTAWNQALATLWLVGSAAVRAEAKQMDRTFWLCNRRIRNDQVADEVGWAIARDEMELVRRDFINAARREVTGTKTSVDDVPVARPSSSETGQLSGSPSVHFPAEVPSRPATGES